MGHAGMAEEYHPAADLLVASFGVRSKPLFLCLRVIGDNEGLVVSLSFDGGLNADNKVLDQFDDE